MPCSAHVPEGGGYELHGFRGFLSFVRSALTLSGSKTLEELNLLAVKAGRMNETQLGAYEGILKLRQDADIDHPMPPTTWIVLSFIPASSMIMISAQSVCRVECWI